LRSRSSSIGSGYMFRDPITGALVERYRTGRPNQPENPTFEYAPAGSTSWS